MEDSNLSLSEEFSLQGNKLERKNTARKALKQDLADKERELMEAQAAALNKENTHAEDLQGKSDEIDKLQFMLQDLKKQAELNDEDISQKMLELARVNNLLELKEKAEPEMVEAHAFEVASLNNRLEKKKATKAGLRRDIADREKDLQAAKNALEQKEKEAAVEREQKAAEMTKLQELLSQKLASEPEFLKIISEKDAMIQDMNTGMKRKRQKKSALKAGMAAKEDEYQKLK